VALAQFAGGGYEAVGSGFFLRLPGGGVAGVTTAHGVARPGAAPERLAFALPGQTDPLAAFEALLGEPGVPRTGADLSVDFVLLPALEVPRPALALEADPRGGPQPGERVTLLAPRPDAPALNGTTLSAGDEAAWVLMDERFEPGGLSGAPVVSAHTGRVVGMAIAAAWRGGADETALLIGLHPAAALLRHAAAAETTPGLAALER
jgi:hypothetical protein